MNQQIRTEEPRYTIKTLQALYYGATYGCITANGILRITFSESICDVYEGKVLSIGPAGLFARTDDGSLVSDVKPVQILHAEVI